MMLLLLVSILFYPICFRALKLKWRARRALQNEDSQKPVAAEKVAPWVRDEHLNDFTDLDAEFREMVVQFGYVTLFVTAFPLGPFFALLNNMIEIRGDAYKLLKDHRRAIPFMAQNIGSWHTVLEFISMFAVITNACLIAFNSEYFEWRWLRNYSDNTSKLVVRLAFIILYEHAVFLFKYLFAFVIPDVPLSVQESIQREKYIADVTIDGEPPAEDDPEALEIMRELRTET